MEHQVITNSELGHAYFYWESKNGRIFVAKQIVEKLGYNRNSTQVLNSLELLDGIDKIKITKTEDPDLFKELTNLNVTQSRAKEIIMLTESGFWKLVLKSQKSIGVKTRHWLANEVLPSIRKTGSYNISTGNPLEIFTERKKQIDTSKSTNSLISRTTQDYSKFWNELHTMVTGMDAKTIKDFYKSKESAKEILRKHAPHLEATEAIITDYWQKGIGLDRIKDTGLHTSLAHSFNAMLSLGIDLKSIGK